MRYSRDLRARQTIGRRSLTQRALAILARYGSASNLYLPGVGAINGITAGNWLDSSGTIAATIGSPVGLVVNVYDGDDFTQITTANKPVLSARYNLLTKTEQFDDAAWTKARTDVTPNAISAPDGTLSADLVARNSTTLSASTQQSISAAIGSRVTLRIRAKSAGTGGFFGLRLQGTYPDRTDVLFNLSDGTFSGPSSTSFTSASASSTNLGSGWWEFSVTATVANSALDRVAFGPSAGGSVTTWEGASATLSNAYVWGAALVTSDQASLPYQRVNTATDYDSNPVYFRARWTFDGSNDSFSTTLTPGNAGFICTSSTFSDIGTTRTLVGAGAGSDASSGIWLSRQITSNMLMLQVGNGTTRNSIGAPYPVASNAVASAGWDSSNMFVGINSTETSGVKSVNCTSTNTMNIGVLTGTTNPMLGTIGATIIMSVLPTISERTILRKFIAALSGVTL